MSSKEKKTVSIKNTPVQRALSRSKKPLLLALFVVGILGGYLYKNYVNDKPFDSTPPAAEQQKQQ